MPMAAPPDASISATVLSAVMSFASTSNSSYDRRFRSATATLAPNPAMFLSRLARDHAPSPLRPRPYRLASLPIVVLLDMLSPKHSD